MTTDQMQLDLAPLASIDVTPEMSLSERYAAFAAANPHVLDALEALADQWFAAGHRKVGVKALWERLRWEAGIQTNALDYRLNNSYTAFVARDLLARRPEWDGRIDLRHQRAA